MVLEAALHSWINGEDKNQIREKAAEAYAKNQKISTKAAKGIFSNL
jgi:hypothetical protein